MDVEGRGIGSQEEKPALLNQQKKFKKGAFDQDASKRQTLQVFWAHPSGRRPWGRSRTPWIDCIYFCLGILQNDL